MNHLQGFAPWVWAKFGCQLKGGSALIEGADETIEALKNELLIAHGVTSGQGEDVVNEYLLRFLAK